MAKETYRNVDMDRDVERVAGRLEVLVPPKGMKFKVEVEFDDKLTKEVGKDPLLKQDMWLAVDAVYQDLIKRIGENLKTTDRGAITLRNTREVDKLKKLADVVNRGIVGAKEVAEERAHKELMAHWTSLQKKRKDYLKYKIKIVCTVTSATAGLATSLALIGASGFSGGASGALGIVAMIKSVNTLVTELVAAAMTVQQSIKVLGTNLAIVEKAWKKSKAGGHVNEISAAVFKEFLGVSQPSVKLCVSNLSTAKSKLTGIDVGMHDMAKDIKSAMGKAAQMRKDMIDDANRRLARHPDPDALKKYGPKFQKNLNDYMRDADDRIMRLLQSVTRSLEVLRKASADLEKLDKRVTELSKVRDGAGYKILDNALMLGNVALSSLNGNGLVDSLKTVTENVVPVVSCFAFDKITAVVIDRDLRSALA